MKKVSVIVPAYNVEKYLDKCLNSLTNQTLDDIEIIVVNDGSTDNSQQIIDRYEEQFSDIVKSYIKENGGLSDTRNYGLTKATGEFVSFVDSDDYVDKCFLEKMYNKAINDKLDIVVCDTVMVYPNGKQIIVSSNLNYTSDDVKNYLLAPPNSCIRLFKKSLFDERPFKNGILYEDLELIPGLVNKTNKIGFVNEGLYFYLQRAGSIMNQTNFNKKLLDIFAVLESVSYKLANYPEELEYIYITHLLRTTTLRFLDYSNTEKYLEQINRIMNENFPNWKQNKYLKKASKKLRVICSLAYNKHYFVLRVLKKITGK